MPLGVSAKGRPKSLMDPSEPYLDASPEDAKELYLMFWDELCESNEDPDLQCHLSMICHAVSAKRSKRVLFIVKETHKNRSAFLSKANSIQFTPKAMIFEKVTVTTINLMVSTAPHSRSR
jgi:hypothetical protein